MALEPSVSEGLSSLEVPPRLFSWTEIIHSWFWRLYDHLGVLILFNGLWFSGLMSLGWFFNHMEYLGSFQSPKTLGILSLYCLESLFSVGWAYGVFRVFTGQEFRLKHYWEGLKRFSLRALFLSILWAGVFLLSYWNFRIFPSFIKEWGLPGYLVEGLCFWILLFWFSMSLFQWPLLFAQDISPFKVITRSFLLVLGNSILSLGLLIFLTGAFLLMSVFFPIGCVFLGLIIVCSMPTLALERMLLKYKITLFNQPLKSTLEVLELESKRGWREFFKPWEFR